MNRLLLVAIALLVTATAAQAGEPFSRHHVSLLAGYARHLDDVGRAYAIGEGRVDPADLGNAFVAGVRYRFSVTRGVAFALEAHRVQARGWRTVEDGNWSTTTRQGVRTDFAGLGLRRKLACPFRPFLQVSAIIARQSEREDDSRWWSGGSDAGFAFTAGGQVSLGRTVSLPLELAWVQVEPYENVSTLGVRTGITWHAGH